MNKYNENLAIYNKYLNSAKAKNPRTFETTYKSYISCMNLFFEWARDNYPDFYIIDKEQLADCVTILEDYISYLQLERNNNSRSINSKLAALSSFFIWATKRNYIEGHPFANKMDRLKTGGDDVRESYFLTDEELDKIDKVLKEDTSKSGIKKYLLWKVFLDTAGRRSAVLSIKVKNIDFDNGLICKIVEKGGKVVDFIIGEDTCKLLKSYIEVNELQADDYIFGTRHDSSKRMDYNTLRHWIRGIGEIVGINGFYPHSIRKTRINQICDKYGLDIASSYANHKRTKVTKDHYVKPKTATDLRNLILSKKK